MFMPSAHRLVALLLAGVCTLGLAACASAAPRSAAAATEAASGADLSAHRAAAVKVVLDAARSERAELRAQAIEAIQYAPDRALPMVQLALGDEHPAVRFSALYVMGKLKLDSLATAVRPLYQRDQPAYVRAGVVYAATRCGFAKPELIGQMGEFLFDDDPSVRANAALLLGEMGNDTAITMLRQASLMPKGDKHAPIYWALLRVQTAEALAKLGDPRGLDAVRSAAYSGFDEVRILAVQTAGRLKDESFWGNLNNFLIENPVEFRLAAAEALARLGHERGLGVMLKSASHKLDTVRAQAAFALGQSHRPEARAALVKLLNDPSASVRLAAAAAVLEATAP